MRFFKTGIFTITSILLVFSYISLYSFVGNYDPILYFLFILPKNVPKNCEKSINTSTQKHQETYKKLLAALSEEHTDTSARLVQSLHKLMAHVYLLLNEDSSLGKEKIRALIEHFSHFKQTIKLCEKKEAGFSSDSLLKQTEAFASDMICLITRIQKASNIHTWPLTKIVKSYWPIGVGLGLGFYYLMNRDTIEKPHNHFSEALQKKALSQGSLPRNREETKKSLEEEFKSAERKIDLTALMIKKENKNLPEENKSIDENENLHQKISKTCDLLIDGWLITIPEFLIDKVHTLKLQARSDGREKMKISPNVAKEMSVSNEEWIKIFTFLIKVENAKGGVSTDSIFGRSEKSKLKHLSHMIALEVSAEYLEVLIRHILLKGKPSHYDFLYKSGLLKGDGSECAEHVKREIFSLLTNTLWRSETLAVLPLYEKVYEEIFKVKLFFSVKDKLKLVPLNEDLVRQTEKLDLSMKPSGEAFLNISSLEGLQDIVHKKDVKSLDLSGNIIYEMSDDIFQGFDSLEELRMKDGFIYKITEKAFVPLKNLRILYLPRKSLPRSAASHLPIGCRIIDEDDTILSFYFDD